MVAIMGSSGSGKSTFSISFLKNTSEFIRCNRDDIRRVLIGDLIDYYKRRDLNGFEKLVSTIMYFIIDTAISKGKSLIIDNTNLKIKDLNNLLKQFDNSDYNINFKLFDCDLLEAKNRVANRDNYPLSFNENHVTICKHVDYIDKQYQQYNDIKEYILKTYPDKIII